MVEKSQREWYLLIGLIAAIFIIFALWSSKEQIRVPVYPDDDEKPRNSQKGFWGSPRSVASKFYQEDQYEDTPLGEFTSYEGPIIEEIGTNTEPEPLLHEPDSETFKKALDAKVKPIKVRETVCRVIFEEIYQAPFPSVRPDFLKNYKTKYKRNLELDGYNADLKLAFETNGKFHYEPAAFTTSLEAHKYQLWKDKYKMDICKDLGIHVVLIPYNIKKAQIRPYIEFYLPHNIEARNKLAIMGWKVPQYPFESPNSPGIAPPTYHMGDTAISEIGGIGADDASEITYAKSYVESMQD